MNRLLICLILVFIISCNNNTTNNKQEQPITKTVDTIRPVAAVAIPPVVESARIRDSINRPIWLDTATHSLTLTNETSIHIIQM